MLASVVPLLLLLGPSGCETVTRPVATEPLHPSLVTARVVAPVADGVLGSLSPLARHIAFALEDPRTRTALVAAMKAPGAAMEGLDLQSCGGSGAAQDLLRTGEARGGDKAATLCAGIRRRGGLILYMDPNRLAAWNGSTQPIVTAIEHPEAGLQPGTFTGYLTARRAINLPSDGSLQGPILVVLPYVHPARRAEADRRHTVRTEARTVPRDPAPGLRTLPAIPAHAP